MKMVVNFGMGGVDRDQYGMARATINSEKNSVRSPSFNVLCVFRWQNLFRSNNVFISYLP
jgi:hypothetical protein